MAQDQARTSRLEARIAPETLALVRRAAELEGRSVSDFVVAAARKVAKETLEEAQLLRLSAEDQARFVEVLLRPPAANRALQRARAAHEEIIAPER